MNVLIAIMNGEILRMNNKVQLNDEKNKSNLWINHVS